MWGFPSVNLKSFRQPDPIAIIVLTSKQSLKILLVEENPSDAALLQDLLGSFSEALFCFETVHSLSAAVKCLEAVEFDAIILDLSVQDDLGGK